ncbi:hypothetical protein J7E26_14805 [Bacillus sp. ISL-51]|nr:hypothetical protein [Bacillus sp. ISL-51]
MNRVTVTKWRNYDLHFRAELNKRRKEIWGSSIDLDDYHELFEEKPQLLQELNNNKRVGREIRSSLYKWMAPRRKTK